LCVQLKTKRTQLLVKEYVRLLCKPFERAWPFRICDIDPSSTISAETGWKRKHLDLTAALLSGNAHCIVYAIENVWMDLSRFESIAQLLLQLGFLLLYLPLFLHLGDFSIRGN